MSISQKDNFKLSKDAIRSDVLSTLIPILNSDKSYTLYDEPYLRKLILGAREILDRNDLLKIIEVASILDKNPVHIKKRLPGQYGTSGSNKCVHFYHLKKTLENIPEFFELANKNELSYKESTGLLFDAFNSNRFPQSTPVNNILKYLNTLLKSSYEYDGNLHDSLQKLKEHFEIIKKQGNTEKSLAIMALGINSGLGIKRSVDLLNYIYNNSSFEEYTLMTLYDVLNDLRTVNVDGVSLYKTFIKLSGENPYYSRSEYIAFSQYLYSAFTQTEFTQQEIVDKINRILKKDGSWSESIVEEIYNPNEEITFIKTKEEYFPEIKSNQLVHGYLPYRKNKSLAEGLADLNKLMKKDIREGAWVFSQEEEMWFSFGGKTTANIGSVRHEFTLYDISKISRTPIFIHIHPEETEIMIAPTVDKLQYPEFQTKIAKFFAAMPSESDFDCINELIRNCEKEVDLSNLIISSSGIIEVEIPKNNNSVEYLANNFKQIKMDALAEFPFERFQIYFDDRANDTEFIKQVLRLVNKKLPKGFSITIHNYSSYINRLKKGLS